jgi:hypothetical protein
MAVCNDYLDANRERMKQLILRLSTVDADVAANAARDASESQDAAITAQVRVPVRAYAPWMPPPPTCIRTTTTNYTIATNCHRFNTTT